ncbi:MAG: rhodanese-like domain-containing protein, partial [Syntrophomonadaceae bacterium]|nr:rhodanese-like domain-containing protein [Syntrophomonadaceae bacterium]
GLTIGKTGGILTDEYLRTSDPFIYAAGDAIQVKNYITGQDTLVPLAGPANRQGWLIANNICGRSIPYKGVQGSSILKIGDLTIAATGNNEYALNLANQPYLAVHTSPYSHATYYPGATQMHIKLLFSPDKGHILGAQIVGRDGVDKRIDVLATAIRAGLTVYDLMDLELAYAPPFSSAKDPVNLAAYAAANVLNGDVEVVHWNEVDTLQANGAFLLDTRTKEEVKHGGVSGAYHIPVDNLRERISELPEEKDILVYCRTGLRSYIATRILKQSGYKAKNISGGYVMYQYINSDR